MKPPARVTALDLIRDFRSAMTTFKADAEDALIANALDIRKAADWLTEKRLFWIRAVRTCQDEVTHAKAELARRQIITPGDRQPDTTQQIKELRLAQARLEYAEERVERCRRWEPAWRRAAEEYEGPARQLAGLLEGEMPKALGLLDRLSGSLDDYVAVVPRPTESASGLAGTHFTTPNVALEEHDRPKPP